MVVPLPFTVDLCHDVLFTVNLLKYVNFESRVIDDVSFDEHNGYDIMEMIHDDLHPRIPVGHVNYGETNVPLDDVAHVVQQFEHENEGNINIPRMTTDDPWLNKLVGNDTFIGHIDNPKPNLQDRFLLDVEDPDNKQVESKFKASRMDLSEGKCAGLKGKKPKKVDDDECETSKQGSKNGDGRKAVNETLSKTVKER
nr:hypothetical protein [Tanacetum cinerariifolium]